MNGSGGADNRPDMGLVTSAHQSRPRICPVEFSFVVVVFLAVAGALAVLFWYPADWKKHDELKRKQTEALMHELYRALLQYSADYNGRRFPPEMDNFLHFAPLEWRRLGVCPASNRRFSIQLIPGWTLDDVEKNPSGLLAYDYNEDELRYKDLASITVIDAKATKKEGHVVERTLTREEMWAVLSNRIEDVPPVPDTHGRNQLYDVRHRLWYEATMHRNFPDGHYVLLLDGTVKWTPDVEFCRMRMKIFHRELVKQARAAGGVFPKDVATAVVEMFFDKDSWWLKNSLGICPGDDEFIGFEMNPARVSLDDPPDTVLMYTRTPVTYGGRNVLFLDGTVKFMSEGEFRDLMRKNKASEPTAGEEEPSPAEEEGGKE